MGALRFIHSLLLTTCFFIFVLCACLSFLQTVCNRTDWGRWFQIPSLSGDVETDRPARAFLFWKPSTFWNDVETNIIRWNVTEKRLREEYAPKGFKEASSTIWARGEKFFGSFLTFLEPVLKSEVLVISWLSEPFKFACLLCGGIL